MYLGAQTGPGRVEDSAHLVQSGGVHRGQHAVLLTVLTVHLHIIYIQERDK